MRAREIFTVALGVGGAVACSGYGVSVANNPPVPAFAPPPAENASICVFRPHGMGAAVITPVTDNRLLVGATNGQGYFCYLAAPGEHSVEVDDARPAVFEVAAGERHYFMHNYRAGIDTLQRVSVKTAHQLHGQCRYTVLDEAPEGRTAPAAVAYAPARNTPTERPPAGTTRVATERPSKPVSNVAAKRR